MVDMPDVPPQYAQVMIVQAFQAQQSAGKTDRTIGVCSLVENPIRMEGNQYSAINSFGPIGAARIYFRSVENREIPGPGLVTVVRNPQHGTLKPLGSDPKDRSYVYLPKPGYFGADRATFLVEMGGKKIRTEYFFKVLDGVADGDYQDKEFCPKGEQWKISLNPDDSNGSLISFQQLKQTHKLPNEP